MAEAHHSDRTDSIDTKLALLYGAHERGDLDIAMSLCESIKDTLSFERQTAGPATGPATRSGGPDVQAFPGTPTQQLPSAWAPTVAGWAFFQALAVSEPVGLPRHREPVDLSVVFGADQVTDPHREVRLLEVHDGNATETPFQIVSPSRRDGMLHCRLLFQASLPAGETAHYVMLYGNPVAQLPRYASDLSSSADDGGQGCGLQVNNQYYGAQLAAHTGQMEHLTYSAGQRSIVGSPRNPMSSGLQLYAGGDGHGESPHIDWAHDYAAADQFQKFRVTHWARSPNVEIHRGPLCVQVRRWGFPHSPAHPLFTPSRLHMDVTYTFHAGLPWFIKESRMTVLQDFDGTIRDDEWVFTGQPFTDSLWMDRDGRLHEGAIAAGHEQHIWGLGFYHHQTRDAFISLFLEHTATGCDSLVHGGATQLDYQGIPRHAQLWSRSPASDRPFRAGAVLQQRNACLLSPYDDAQQAESLRHALTNPLHIEAIDLPVSDLQASIGPELHTTGTAATPALIQSVWAALRRVRDDMFYTVDANVVDMGYIYDVSVQAGTVHVLMTMPHRGRPKYGYLVGPMRERLLELDGVSDVIVDFTWEPAWTVARLTAAGRAAMGLEP